MATCDQDIYNNITYFVNPHFPDPDINMTECKLKLRKIDDEISQIRLEFIHFNLVRFVYFFFSKCDSILLF